MAPGQQRWTSPKLPLTSAINEIDAPHDTIVCGSYVDLDGDHSWVGAAPPYDIPAVKQLGRALSPLIALAEIPH